MPSNHDTVTDAQMARRTFKNTAVWKARVATIRAGHPDCALCQKPIRYDLKKPHPLSFSVDHKPGFRVEDQVGKLVWECRRICTAIEGLRPAHYGCNSADAARRGFPHYIPVERTPEAEPLEPVVFRNTKTGETETFLVNKRTILSPDWVAA